MSKSWTSFFLLSANKQKMIREEFDITKPTSMEIFNHMSRLFVRVERVEATISILCSDLLSFLNSFFTFNRCRTRPNQCSSAHIICKVKSKMMFGRIVKHWQTKAKIVVLSILILIMWHCLSLTMLFNFKTAAPNTKIAVYPFPEKIVHFLSHCCDEDDSTGEIQVIYSSNISRFAFQWSRSLFEYCARLVISANALW